MSLRQHVALFVREMWRCGIKHDGANVSAVCTSRKELNFLLEESCFLKKVLSNMNYVQFPVESFTEILSQELINKQC